MIPNVDHGNSGGLSPEEAARRLAAEGYNELPSARPNSLLAIAAGVLREPMILLLVAAGTLYLILGDLAEATLLIASIFFVVGINLYQERRTERALEALRDLSSPRALVVRGGQRLRIPGREVVRGDTVILAEGDRVPADALLLTGLNLAADESLLTGESQPAEKVAGTRKSTVAEPGGDDQGFVYSGTMVVRGQGIAKVLAVGAETAIGKIGKALQTLQVEQTSVQRETRRVVQVLATIALGLCVLVSLIYGLTHGWESGLLTGITLAMAIIIPEEFPVVLTVFLALGAFRLSRQRVLTRRVPAVETLGAATVLCVDKTGTLTLNQMAVRRLFGHDLSYEVMDRAPVPEPLRELVEYGLLASQPVPFDPMERAIKELADHTLSSTSRQMDGWVLAREYPLSSELLALSHAWRPDGASTYVIAAKGAPESISELCRLEEAETRKIGRQVEGMAVDGLRVLGVAKAYFREAWLPDSQREFEFTFLGLIGLIDPVRPSVPTAIRECYRAGVRVVMITGDHAGTARHIAREAGLQPVEEVISGFELGQLSDAELRRRVQHVNVFARVAPEQKLRLVNALKANGEIVAMTGDGVNDAPALKAAHIGIAMGGRGTDVAREAAALVLLDDDFSSIVRAVRLGRAIYDNLRKAMAYLLAVHVPIAGLSVLPVLLQTPLVLLPAHVVFLELIIDPACSIAFEAEPAGLDVMTRPPRSVREPLFGRGLVRLSLLQGASVMLVVLTVYLLARGGGDSEERARAMTFTSLVVGNLALILSNRSWTSTILASLRVRNAPFWSVAGGALALLGLVLYVPYLRDVFHFASLKPDELAISLAAGLVSIFWFEGLKLTRGYKENLRIWPSGPSALDCAGRH